MTRADQKDLGPTRPGSGTGERRAGDSSRHRRRTRSGGAGLGAGGTRASTGVAAILMGLVVLWSGPAAWAAPTSGGLRWHASKAITSGVPVAVSSVNPCPPVPTPGDTALVGVFLSFGPGGSQGQTLPVRPGGSWAGDVTFGFVGVTISRTTISAECLDYNGHGAVPYAEYRTRHVRIYP